MTNGDLTGRHVLVTGAAGGIGAAVAAAVADAGASTVVVTDVPGSDLAPTVEAVEKHLARTLVLTADLADEAAVVALAQDAVATVGRIDVLVNAAGVHERLLAG